MGKAVLISIQPKWCELIASGKKTVEVRKTKPKLETPFKCYIYMTAGDASYPVQINGAPYICHNNGGQVIIGEFICDNIEEIGFSPYNHHGEYICFKQPYIEQSCLSFEEMFDYLGEEYGYGWHISDLVIYDMAKELREFKPYNRTEDDCKYSHLGYAIPKCSDCHECYVKRPPQSWCYVESEG